MPTPRTPPPVPPPWGQPTPRPAPGPWGQPTSAGAQQPYAQQGSGQGYGPHSSSQQPHTQRPYAQPGGVPAAPPRRGAFARLRAEGGSTVLLVVVAAFSALASVAFTGNASPDSGAVQVWSIAGMLAAVVVVGSLARRRTQPVLVALIGSTFAILLPGDALVALIGLSWVVATRDRTTSLRVGALVTVATGVAVVRDALRAPQDRILATTGTDGTVSVVPWWVFLVLAVVCLAAAVGTGLYRRTQDDLVEVRAQAQDDAQQSARLRTELTRQEERDLIAREVHDTLAHRLSLVSLQAGALQVAAAGNPELTEIATDVQSNAHRSLTDLRGLIDMLRDPSAHRRTAEPELPVTLSLEDLRDLLDASRRAGDAMLATVVIRDAESASTALTHAAYRIVQEALTNIHKHAPGAPIDVDLAASAAQGVRIVVTNPIPTGAPGRPIPGAGAGLTGIHERVRLLGGRSVIGPVEGGRYVVDVWLPWNRPGQDPDAEH